MKTVSCSIARNTSGDLLLLVAAIILAGTTRTHSQRMSYYDNGLTAVPPSPPDAFAIQSLNLDNNNIAKIDAQTDFVNYTSLTQLDINNNLLTVFPCLPNINQTLTSLYLTGNRISYIPPACLSLLQNLFILMLNFNFISHLPDVYMASLHELDLSNNSFTALPALPVLGSTLHILAIDSNPMRLLSAINLNLLTNLDVLDLSYNQLTTVPTWCNKKPGVFLGLKDNPLTCDCRLRWFYTNTDGFFVNLPSCAEPPSLAGLELSATNVTLLTCSDNATVTSRAGHFTRMPFENFRCPNQNIAAARVRVSSLIQCATFCLSTPDCTSFNFGISTDISNSYYCEAFASVDVGTNLAALPNIDWSWYILD